jgi:hypothetical protein
MAGHMLNPEHFAAASIGSDLTVDSEVLKFRVHTLGELELPTGLIVACDPLVFSDSEAFSERVPSGLHPVEIAVAEFSGGDQRVAFAQVRFSENDPVSWRMAVIGGQDASSLGPQEIFGYGVDAGIGCFMAHETSRALMARLHRHKDFFENIVDELEKTDRDTWSWAVIQPDEDQSLNLIAFSSGYGDGIYASYFGYDGQGEVACLVTDFRVIEGPL